MLGNHPQLEAQERLSLFPTEVYIHDYNPESWADYYADLVESMQSGEGRINANGNWCSDDDLDLRPEWLPLKELILSTAHACVQDRGIIYDSINMNCMWANSHPKGSFHQQHHHPNSMYSGVVYLRTPKPDAGNFYFRDPRIQAHQWVFDYKEGKEQGDYLTLQPKQGRMIIFPSWLEHGTLAAEQQTELRISVSFNLLIACSTLSKHSIRARLGS